MSTTTPLLQQQHSDKPLPSVGMLRPMGILERIAYNVAFYVLGLPVFPALIGSVVLRLRNARRAAEAPDRQGASITALWVLLTRASLDTLGLRPDPGARKLQAASPLASPFFNFCNAVSLMHMRACIAVSSLASLRFGTDPRVNYTRTQAVVQGRLLFFDGCLEYLRPTTQQLVIMGAGYDTRAINNACGGASVVYEVDRPETQAQKIKLMAKTGLKNALETKYVACNFNNESPWDKLAQTGFDRTKPFVVTWEGVTYYLPEDVVVDFLTKAGAVMKGNRHAYLMLDHFFQDHNDRLPSFVKRTLKGIGEEWLSFYPPDFDGYLRSKQVPLRVFDHSKAFVAGVVLLVPTE